MNHQKIVKKLNGIAVHHKNAFHAGSITGQELGAVYSRLGRIKAIIRRIDARKQKRQKINDYALPRLQALMTKEPYMYTGVYWTGSEKEGFTFQIATITEDLIFTGESAVADFKKFFQDDLSVIVMWERDWFFGRYGHLIDGHKFNKPHYDVARIGELYTTIPKGDAAFMSTLMEHFNVTSTGARAVRDLAKKFDTNVIRHF